MQQARRLAVALNELCLSTKEPTREHTNRGFQDVRHALRFWANRPWQTGFTIAALAIGIGANTGVFSVVNALLLRSLPFREPEGLALVHDFIPPHDSAKQFHEWSQQSTYLSDAALFEEIDATLAVRVSPAACTSLKRHGISSPYSARHGY